MCVPSVRKKRPAEIDVSSSQTAPSDNEKTHYASNAKCSLEMIYKDFKLAACL